MSNYSADQIALRAHLEADAAVTEAKVASGEYTFATYYTADLEHWAEMGVFSVEDLRRHDAMACYSDGHKDIYGYRDRYTDMDNMSTDEIEEMVDAMYQRQEDARQRDEERQAQDEAKAVLRAKELGVSLADYKRWQEAEYGDDHYDTGWC